MKIIKASVDLETWTLPTTCKSCKSELGIEAGDLRHNWTKDGCYYFKCELCDNTQYLKDSDVPEIVKADAKRHRADPIRYID